MDLGQSRRGVDMGPSALRVAGLQARLKALGHTVIGEPDDGARASQYALELLRWREANGAGAILADRSAEERKRRHHLGVVGRKEVEGAIREPVEANGRDVDDDTLAVMVEGTGGYPFLIQFVGAQVWRLHPVEPTISMEDAQRGVSNDLRRLAP